MLRILRFRWSSKWIEHVRQDNILTTADTKATYERVFPGCSIQLDMHRITVLWEVPGLPLNGENPEETRSGTAPLRPPPAFSGDQFDKSNIEKSLVQVFEHQVTRYEQCPAIKSGTNQLTYGELNAFANRLARQIFRQLGQSVEPVAIILPQGAAILVAMLGILKAGKAYVALDPSHPADRLTHYINDAQTRLVITDTEHYSYSASLIPDEYDVINMDHLDSELPGENLGLSIDSDQMASIFYTSGSTGEPKGIARQHLQILHSTWHNTNAYTISSKDRHSLLGFCGHTASVPDIFDTLLNGATLCLFDPREHSLADLADWLIKEKITIFHPPVELFRRFFSTLHGKNCFPHVRMVILAGQSVLPFDVKQYWKHFGPECRLLHRLASTETGAVAHLLIDHQTPIGDSVPVGFATADKDILILDEAMQPVVQGEVGEIAVRSRYLASGYWLKPELTDSKFLPDPDDMDKQIYLTNDLGRITREGALEHLGRKDLIVKIRGYRFHLETVEAALRSLPNVMSGAVTVKKMSSGNNRLVGYVIPETDQKPTTSELHFDLGRILPTYMIPTIWVFPENIPMTSSGKVDRNRLPEPTLTRPVMNSAFVAPGTRLEQQIADVWSELLELDKVGIEDNFFELGGDSLSVLHMSIEVEKLISQPIPPSFFQYPTIQYLSRLHQSHSTESILDKKINVEVKDILENPKLSERNRKLVEGFLSGNISMPAPTLKKQLQYKMFPYSFRIKFLKKICQIPTMQKIFFNKETQTTKKFLKAIGVDAHKSAKITTSQLFRQLCRRYCSGLLSYNVQTDFEQWTSISGQEILDQAIQRGKGVILVDSHTLTNVELVHILNCLGYNDLYKFRGKMLLKKNTSEFKALSKYLNDKQLETVTTKYFSMQMNNAQQFLNSGKIVWIAPDGTQGANGHQDISVPFFGRNYRMKRGFAELALKTGATIIPVRRIVTPTGQVNTTFMPPLDTESQELGYEERLKSLVEQYAVFLEQIWQDDLDNIPMQRMKKFLRMPGYPGQLQPSLSADKG